VSGNRATEPKSLSAGRLAVLLAIMAVMTVSVGATCSLFGEVALTWQTWTARLLRLLAAATVGAALASAGMALQGLLRNPLAEPYILGISSGAGVGVLLGLALANWMATPTWAVTPTLALAGALATCGVVFGIAQRRGRLDPYVLLLSGVIVNAFNGAIMFAIFLVVPKSSIADFAVWAMGGVAENLAITNPGFLAICTLAVIAGWAILFFRGSAFNALGLGDDVASSTGVSVHFLRAETFVVVGVMTSAAVMLAGPVGFLGLIVPHICRLTVGPDHRRLAIVSGFGGAIFLMAADTLCRLAGGWLQVGEVPVGIVTAFSGGPFFIYLLRSRLREGLQ
jgi:iron complex transport system permease protein